MGKTKKKKRKIKINLLKQLRNLIIILIIVGGVIGIINLIKIMNKGEKKAENNNSNVVSVANNGWLHIENQNIKNENNETIQLVGVSSNSFQWYSDCITNENLKILKEDWGVNVIRLAIFPESEGVAYSEKMNDKIEEKVDLIVKHDMYVIIDWHIAGNPNKYKEKAKILFEEMSKKYANTYNVLFEICNEPSGENINWNDDIKPYAEEIIEVIRENSKKSIIIVGTPKKCTDFSQVCDNLIKDKSILYSYHFYVGDEKVDIDNLNKVIEEKIPIIVSEWGITDSRKKGSIYLGVANKWVKVLNDNNISWVIWSFSRADEKTSILKYEYKPSEKMEDYLTEAGDYTKKTIMKIKK